MHSKKLVIGLGGVTAVAALTACTAYGAQNPAQVAQTNAAPAAAAPTPATDLNTYQVTVTNLTKGQPFSIPVAATVDHQSPLHMFQIGDAASRELDSIAQDGMQKDMVQMFKEATGVTDVVDVGKRLTPQGISKGGYTDTVTFTIKAHQDDQLSLAAMLVCTNDGFTGVDHLPLPTGANEQKTVDLAAYDAGAEQNTEKIPDLVDGCSALGPAPLPGKPNGNDDTKTEAKPVGPHPGIQENGDLKKADYDWGKYVGRLTVVRIDGGQK